MTVHRNGRYVHLEDEQGLIVPDSQKRSDASFCHVYRVASLFTREGLPPLFVWSKRQQAPERLGWTLEQTLAVPSA